MATRNTSKDKSAPAFLKGKTVLITGGTGTFGRAFIARLLVVPGITKIIIFSRDELKQSQVQSMYPNEKRLRYFIGDVRDSERLKCAFEGVDIVVHAAALKQVPATEYNPFEAVKTNIVGSQNVIDAALAVGVSKVLLVSSDKAVEPINLYGATKLAAEKLFVAANVYVKAKNPSAFSVVRYGNVIGSRGSLIELVDRLRSTGRIPLTDERMTRFWIRIEQVTDIVLECLSLMRGGEIFIPKMKNMRVADVIKHLAPECKIDDIGIRPGEKLHETLITEYEALRAKELSNVYVIKPEFGSTDTRWLRGKPGVSEDFSYSSDNKNFLLTAQEAKVLFAR
ncbi:MAG: UDP-N-acetylglucosamine 4,6-dehydratase (inverting) [Candidatus Kaiserbacteria bacterium]|nr:UDP-N-acetylglucosamine 4,6-dehydratase (inverting) [Candidatus Kaiserbacteria bacterium]